MVEQYNTTPINVNYLWKNNIFFFLIINITHHSAVNLYLTVQTAVQ